MEILNAFKGPCHNLNGHQVPGFPNWVRPQGGGGGGDSKNRLIVLENNRHCSPLLFLKFNGGGGIIVLSAYSVDKKYYQNIELEAFKKI